ncbi:hypothetical protein [[Phormidium] sp. ETS-05]|uniref:hypothetical protein n=1 Tax=[Phormidium] sp. ETS-05 TaxID=222819 RepID=UPI0018EEE6CD|nr:hypothetical protein [[Phormidium] sp. ETS-05]
MEEEMNTGAARTPEEQQNINLVLGYLGSIATGSYGDYIDANFSDDVQFNVITQRADYNDEGKNHEQNLLSPTFFPFVGKEGAKNFTDDLLEFRELRRFNIADYIVDGNNVALFGDYVQVSKETGNLGVTPFALEVQITDGKISLYHIREDSWASITPDRTGGNWSGQFGQGDAPPIDNIIFGSTAGENLVGIDGVDLIYGYQQADTINGGAGDDEIWPGSSNDLVTGGGGSDKFVLVGGEGTNTITDFEDGVDFIGLGRKTDYVLGESVTLQTTDLNFADLTIGANGSDATVTVTATGELLAVIQGAAGAIDESDFMKMPTGPKLESLPAAGDPTQVPAPADEALNLQVIQGFFQSIQTGTFAQYIPANFTPDAQYILVRPDNDYSETTSFHERSRIMPWKPLYTGSEEITSFINRLNSVFTIQGFNIDNTLVEGNTVAMFGDASYLDNRTGNLVNNGPFAIKIEMENGKIDSYYFLEETYGLATAFRDAASWNRFGQEVIFGSSAAENLVGTDGSEVIYGYQGNDTLDGGAGPDSLWGGAGTDMLMGSDGTDSLYGNTGEDMLMGGAGNDWLNGNQDNDTVDGGEGNDTIYGGKATDALIGGIGDDWLSGNLGTDTIDGGEGNDTLYGGKENDTVTGGNGDDWLWGDLGDDMLSGGVGVDTFVFGSDTGTDIVMDYTDGEDKIALTGGLTFAQLSLTQGTDGTQIRVGEQLLVTLMNVQVTALGADDFSPIA